MLRLRVTTNRLAVERALSDFAQRQVPYATALALTATAKAIAAAELREIANVMPTATRFTLGGVGVTPAKKQRLEAVVFVKDIQAAYLKPYVTDGRQVLFGSRRAQPVPIKIATDSAGNIGRGRLKRMIGKSDVFVGAITFPKSGETISGVWQRPRRPKGAKRKDDGTIKGLKLLVRFQDPVVVKPRLAWRATAERVFAQTWQVEFDRAFARAMSTGKGR